MCLMSNQITSEMLIPFIISPKSPVISGKTAFQKQRAMTAFTNLTKCTTNPDAKHSTVMPFYLYIPHTERIKIF